MTWVFVYDVSDDTVRARVAHVLEQFGDRVQESVFECRLDKAVFDEVTRRLRAELKDPEHGNVRVYRACADCLSQSIGIGVVATTTSSRPDTIV